MTEPNYIRDPMLINYDRIASAAGVDRETVKKVLYAYAYSGGSSTPPDYHALLLSLIAGMGLCDHMGDVADDVFEVIKRMGIEVPDDIDMAGLRAFLGAHHGAVSLWGGDSTFDPEDDCAGCYNQTYNDTCTCDDSGEV